MLGSEFWVCAFKLASWTGTRADCSLSIKAINHDLPKSSKLAKISKNELSHGHVLRVWFLSLLGLRNSSGHLPCDISWNFALRWKRRLAKNLMAFRVRSLSNAESSTEIRPWSGIHGWPGASKVHSFLLEQISKCALVCWKLRLIAGNCASCAAFFENQWQPVKTQEVLVW